MIRYYIPGSNWIYFKLYTGPSTCDYILINIIAGWIGELRQQHLIRNWFFIRFADPHHHLRIRLYTEDRTNVGTILNKFFDRFNDLINQELVWNIKIDTYNRELERYGSISYDHSEDIFCIQSESVLKLLTFLENEPNGNTQWLFALKAIDITLKAFEKEDQKKTELLERLKNSFAQEFNLKHIVKKQIDNKYRAWRSEIESFMQMEYDVSNPSDSIEHLFNEFQNKMEKPISEIIKLERNNNLDVMLDDLIISHIHMLMNRIFVSNNRKYELICYDFLFRYYSSKLARHKTY